MSHHIPVLREEHSLLKALFWFHEEELSPDVVNTPEYIKAQMEVDRICSRLKSLLPVEKIEAADQLLRDLSDAATTPLHVVESKGFREGFQMALRLLKELERWS